jgi:hypothetical protein
VLSDGTLRLLALVTLKNDPQHRGVLCFEEPENGVHPFRLKNLAENLLHDLATDFSDPDQAKLPLRQLLINTHSTTLVKQSSMLPNILFAYVLTRAQPGNPPMRITRIVPVKPNPYQPGFFDKKEKTYVLAQAIEYLESGDVGEALAEIRSAAE